MSKKRSIKEIIDEQKTQDTNKNNPIIGSFYPKSTALINESKKDAGSYKLQALILLLLGCIGFLIYSNTLNVPFILDDIPNISKNPAIPKTNLTSGNIFYWFYAPRPFAMLSFSLNYYFHQYDLMGYHIVNIAIHILTGIFLYMFLKTTLIIMGYDGHNAPYVLNQNSKMEGLKTPNNQQPITGNQSFNLTFIAFFSAMVWLVHPVQTQSVTYIVQRMTSMSTLFFILSFLLFIKGRLAQQQTIGSPEQTKHSQVKKDMRFSKQAKQKPFGFKPFRRSYYLWFSGAILSWIISLGCKQTAATLPFFIFLYEWYFFQNLNRDWLYRQLKYFYIILIVSGIITLQYLGLNPWDTILSISDYANNEFTFTERVLTQFRVVIYYLTLLAYPNPSRLNLDYDFSLSHTLINPVTTLISLCAIVGLIGFACYRARKNRLLSFCIFWYFGNLVIESSIIPLAIIFEHRLYIPSMLACLLPVLLIYRYIKPRLLGIGILCTVVLVFSLWTYERNNVWGNAISLWEDCVAKSPNKSRPHVHLGGALIDQGKITEGIDHYKKALRIKPKFVQLHNDLGNSLARIGNTTEAFSHFSEALQIKPDSAETNYNLGNFYAKLGNTTEAFSHFKMSLQIDPYHAKAHYSQGNLHADLGNTMESIKHFAEALQIKPDFAEAHYAFGMTLEDQGKTSEAIKHYTEALRIKPDFAEANNNLGNLLAEKGNIKEAIRHFTEALQNNPDQPEAHYNLGFYLTELGKIDEAISHFKEALRIRPDHADAFHYLGVALYRKGRGDEAISQFEAALRINPDHVDAHNNIGAALFHKGRIDEAISHYEDALQIKPDHVDAHNNMGIALSHKGRLDEAINHFTQVLQIIPDHIDAHNNLGIALYQLQRVEEAMNHFAQVIRINPDHAEAHNNMGIAMAYQGRLEEATIHFNKALRIEPNYDEARNNLKAVSRLKDEKGLD